MEIILTFIVTIIIYGSLAITNILAARYFEPTTFGTYNAIILWPTIIYLLGNLGLTTAITYFVASREYSTKQVMSNALIIILFLSIFVGGVGFFIIPLALQNYPTEVINYSRIYHLIYFPSIFILQSYSSCTQGNQKFVAFNLQRMLFAIIPLIGIILLSQLGFLTLRTYLLIQIIGIFATGLCFFIYGFGKKWVGLHFNKQISARLISYGTKIQLGNVISFGNLRLDQMFLSIFFPVEMLGLYAAVVTISAIIFVPSQAITFISFPQVSQEKTSKEKINILGFYFRLAFLITIILFFLAQFLLPIIIQYVYGVSYIASLQTGKLLLFASVLLAIKYQIEVLFKSDSKPLIITYSEVISLIITTLGLVILLPRFGILGAGLTSIFAYFNSMVYLLVKFSIDYKTNALRLVVPVVNDITRLRSLVKKSGNIQNTSSIN